MGTITAYGCFVVNIKYSVYCQKIGPIDGFKIISIIAVPKRSLFKNPLCYLNTAVRKLNRISQHSFLFLSLRGSIVLLYGHKNVKISTEFT